MALFTERELKLEALNNFMSGFTVPELDEKKKIIANWQKGIESGKVQKSKEEQIKGEFLDKFFGLILNYAYESHETNWNFEKEFKSFTDGKKPDAALGFFDADNKQDVRCVVEVKGGLVNLDKKQNRIDFAGSSVDQAFSYVHRMGGKCQWVIVTNMIELRLYRAQESGRYESFQLNELLINSNLARFLYLLSHSQLFLETGDSKIEQLYTHRLAEQKKISHEFYATYHDLRLALFGDLKKNHPAIEPKKLFRYTQKLIDRIIFICFVRDRELVGTVLIDVQETVRKSFRKDKERIWPELKYLFTAMNEGLTEQGRDIPEFNGGLFKEDTELNSLHIKDSQLMQIINFVAAYDFQSQLDVNILGHIFEQSISDIEEFQNSFDVEKSKEAKAGKRKKDGIYYTPDYITRYMVREAVGGWLEDRRKEILSELKINELPELTAEDYESAGSTANEKIQLHITFWERYRAQLKNIKVLDPACGSGAFLNQVFDFLWKEWDVLMKEWNRLTRSWKDQLRDFAVAEPFAVYNGIDEWKIKKEIVANNIYGVDLNTESVEITKLSLWLKTANRKESLADLSSNIKQGNSLIDDAQVAGDDAFNWNKEFAPIMKKGGFNVVVGNPPWGASINKDQSEFLKEQFLSKSGELESYAYFIEKSSILLSPLGLVSLITPNTWLYLDKYSEIRIDMLNKHLLFIIELEKRIFEDVPDIIPAIFLSKKEDTKSDYNLNTYKLKKGLVPDSLIKHDQFITKTINIKNWKSFENTPFLISLDDSSKSIIDKLDQFKPLSEKYNVRYGIKTGDNDKYIKTQIKSVSKDWKYCLASASSIKRYKIEWEGDYLDWGSHLSGYTQKSLESPKIVIQYIRKISLDRRLICAYDREGIYYPLNNFSFIEKLTDEYSLIKLLAVLNSSLINFYFKNVFIDYNIKPKYIEKIPIPKLANEKTTHDIDLKSNLMLSLHQSIQQQSAKFLDLLQASFKLKELTTKLKHWYELEFITLITELEKAGAKISKKNQSDWLDLFKEGRGNIQHTQQLIAITDKEIDRLVYALYELTPEEIEIVKKS